jgi:hypothetical protein
MTRRQVFASNAIETVLDTSAKPLVLTSYSHVCGRAYASSVIITLASTPKSRA